YPALVHAAVERSRVLAKKRTAVVVANHERSQIKDWFAEVLTEMVVAAPELRGHTLEDALVLTYGEGMRLVVLGDTVVMPGYPSGIVVSQSPSAGSRALRGGDISVMLSRA
ncbi:MAG: PASTA domain-containing protein, partial [Ktedonobacterales bacterium]|nr:PASTA domain-containing protein [Ktedonobacterales bacterium]